MATNEKTPNGPVYIERVLNLPFLLQKKSHFLFGPRQTGKTSLIRHSLKGVRSYDLLDNSVYLSLSQDPGRIAQEINPRDKIVVVDEIQRLPVLLNEVHRLIEERRHSFSSYWIQRTETSARWSKPLRWTGTNKIHAPPHLSGAWKPI